MARYEIKYVVSEETRNALLPQLAARMQPDPHGTDGPGVYHVHSLYMDSPELEAYHEKMDGLFWRCKLRVRYYRSQRGVMNLEVKERLANQIIKTRFLLEHGHRDAVLQGQRLHEYENPAIEIYNRHVERQMLRPKLLISYVRTARVAPQQGNLRVTFDSSLTVKRCRTLHDDDTAAYPLLHPRWSVLEIKFERRMPAWVSDLVQRHSLSCVPVSKYCMGVERLVSLRRLEREAAYADIAPFELRAG